MAVRPKFSLRTLLLFTLVLGSCAVLYLHREPWVSLGEFPSNSKLTEVLFSNDQQYFVIGYRAHKDQEDFHQQDVYSVHPLKKINSIQYGDGKFLGAGYSPEGPISLCMSKALDGNYQIEGLDALTQNQKWKLTLAHYPDYAAFSQDGLYLIGGVLSSTTYPSATYVWKWNGQTYGKFHEFNFCANFIPLDYWTTGESPFSGSGYRIVDKPDGDSSTKIWDLESNATPIGVIPEKHTVFAIHPNQPLALVRDDEKRSWYIWDINMGAGKSFSNSSGYDLAFKKDLSLGVGTFDGFTFFEPFKGGIEKITYGFHKPAFSETGTRLANTSVVFNNFILWGDGFENYLPIGEAKAEAGFVSAGPVIPKPVFSKDDHLLLAATNYEKSSLFERRRPEAWWGLFWLPESWLSLVLLLAFVWSFFSDLRTLKLRSVTGQRA